MSLENLFLSLLITSKSKELAIISLWGLINARMREVERPWLGGNTKSLVLKRRPVNVVVMLWSHESKRPLCREGGFMHRSQSSISEMRLLWYVANIIHSHKTVTLQRLCQSVGQPVDFTYRCSRPSCLSSAGLLGFNRFGLLWIVSFQACGVSSFWWNKSLLFAHFRSYSIGESFFQDNSLPRPTTGMVMTVLKKN